MRFSPIVLLLVVVVIGIGTAVSLWQAKEANDARNLAVQRFTEAEEQPADAAEPVESQEQAIAAIKKLGGKVTIDEKSPNKPVIKVDLSHSKVTDKGLIELSELFKLQSLNLSGTNITDAGLEQLKKLTKLQTLDLRNTNITDAGLKHLKRLTKLRGLDLNNTKVTEEGLEKLQTALPDCDIRY